MIQPGNIIDVWAVVQKHNTSTEVFGVFPTERQAEGYVKEVLPNKVVSVRVVPHKAFRPGAEARVLLLEIRHDTFYELAVDYEPDEDRIRRELRKQAWDKLTPEERNALNLEEPI